MSDNEAAAAQWDALNRHLVTARLASATVHDARNALQTISGTAELIAMRRPGDKQIEDRVASIQLQCADLGQRLEAFRALQLERPPAVGPLNLHQIVSFAIELRETSLGRLNIAMVNHVPQDLAAQGDAPGVVRIVLNLLLNAERSLVDGGRGGRITVSGAADGAVTRMVIDDDGSGVSEEEAPHLFSKTRADGLVATGLWTSARLAGVSGGTLRWLGADGRRAGFELELASGR
jgi:signal transduction histidine kinase